MHIAKNILEIMFLARNGIHQQFKPKNILELNLRTGDTIVNVFYRDINNSAYIHINCCKVQLKCKYNWYMTLILSQRIVLHLSSIDTNVSYFKISKVKTNHVSRETMLKVAFLVKFMRKMGNKSIIMAFSIHYYGL